MSKKILLIESDGAFAQELANALEARGLQARVTGDGKEGLDLARIDRPDCIILCVELPKMSGYSICNKLKKDEQLKDIPLVIISAEATPETFEQHRKLKTRAEDYLIKPFDAATLLQKLAALMELPPEPEAPAEEMVTLDEVTLEDVEELDAGAGVAAAALAAEEDDDLKLLDDAFENLASPDPTTMIANLTGDAEGGSATRAAMPEPEPEALEIAAGETEPNSEVDRLGDEADAALAALGADDDLDLAAAAALLDEEHPAALPAAAAAARPSSERMDGVVRELEQARAEAREQEERAQTERAAAEERLRAAEAGASEHARRAAAAEESVRATAERARAAEERATIAEEDARAAAARTEAAEEQLAAARRELEVSRHEATRVAAEAQQARERAEELGRELGAAQSRASGFENELGALRPQLAAIHGELAGARATVENAHADAERATAELVKRVAELEALLAKHEERVVKAYQKIKNDEKIREKTRKALTIALQLLEERGPNGTVGDVQPRKE